MKLSKDKNKMKTEEVTARSIRGYKWIAILREGPSAADLDIF